jgi:sugar phosphate isomerase/epimerase
MTAPIPAMKLALQIYSVRNAGDFETQLDLARAAGFEWIESVATHGLDPARFAQTLTDHGLKLSSMHASLVLLETNPAQVIEACRATGCALVVMPWLPRGEISATGAGWAALGKRLAGIGSMLAAHELRFAYHNHDFEFFRYDGKAALEWIFDAAPEASLGWEADLGWVRRAGEEPMNWIRRYAGRLVAVHAKDIAPDGPRRGEDGWCTLGHGIVGWDTLLPALREHCDLFIFEHDNPENYLETLRSSLQLMQAKLN